MPAREEEIEDALEEGVDIQFLMAPVEVMEKDGKVVGLKCIKMELGAPDKSGRRRPVPVEGSEFVVDTDVIIPAIGQRTDTAFLKGSTGVDLDRWNNINVDPVSFETTRKGVFAGGDAQTGPGIAIGAVAAGREAAISISRYLDGVDLDPEQVFVVLGLYGQMVSRYGRLLRDQAALSGAAIDNFLGLVGAAIDLAKTEMGYPVELGSEDEG